MTLNKNLSISVCHLSFVSFFKRGWVRIQNLSQKQERWVPPDHKYKLHEVKNYISFLLFWILGLTQCRCSTDRMMYHPKDSGLLSPPFLLLSLELGQGKQEALGRTRYRIYSPSSQGLPKLGVALPFLRGGVRGSTHHPSSLCLPGPVLLEKTLILVAMTTRGSGSQRGWGSGGKQLAVPTLGLNACWAQRVGEPKLHLLPKKGFFPEGPLPVFYKTLSIPSPSQA